DGEAGLDAFMNETFDCVLLDYHLPGKSGIETFHAMSQVPSTTAAVVFLTGEENEDLALTAMKAGVVDFLNKNELQPAMLRRAIRYAQARHNFLYELAERGRRDALTNLPNRSVFDDTLSNAIAQGNRHETMVATLLLDLDHFKDINDTLGHPAGDEMLQTIAVRLTQSTRESDTVIRLGGDEFVIIAPNIGDQGDAIQLALKIHDAMSRPVLIGDKELHISTSIGIAMAPHDGQEPAKILKSADLALYRAKGEGRGQYCFYDTSMDTAAHARQKMEQDLRLAIEQSEFELHYQPKVSVSTGIMIGAEALLRWRHPVRGFVGPDEFIPVAERNRLILPIGEWVLRTAFAQMVAWKNAALPIHNCSVNLSPVQLSEPALISVFDDIIAETGVDPSFMEVEITESALMKRVDSIVGTLNALRDRGISVSIDDFGAGYSSLVYLKQLPIDKLKIDQSFVAGIVIDNDDAEIARTVIQLGKSMGLEVIAEGVETSAQLNLLRDYGCEQIQGYYYSRALPAEAFYSWYVRQKTRRAIAFSLDAKDLAETEPLQIV
ncbi:MAG: GGDEF domain-containing response regulator, partial [Proteobacteria bacterium]|nr:GGDEF domain-containing response regulator [Pseudomonadota bacterium]